ncbi:MAG: vWA domain-containing protein [Bauldia sp.]
MADNNRTPAQQRPAGRSAKRAKSAEIEAFLAAAGSLTPTTGPDGRGRLIFALDATMSRQPTWDTAQRLQAEMFEAAARIGGLDIQLVYFRGFNECRASRWVGDAGGLRDLMTGIQCCGGHTQIGKVLSHARRETARRKVNAVVFIGDALEEKIDDLAAKAGELGMLGVRMFVFQEGRDALVERGLREIARLSGGAYARFDSSAAGQLAELLRAVAVYAAGGLKALADRREGAGRLLLEQLR